MMILAAMNQMGKVETEMTPMLLLAIDSVYEEVNDPYLSAMKSAVLVKSSLMEEAKQEMQKAMSAMPKNLHVRMGSISLKLQDHEFAGAIDELDGFDADFPTWINKYFRYTDGHDAFKESDEGKAWFAKREATKRKAE